MARSDYHGKRGGNAGDDYHELWAARRALELIAPDNDLIGLTVEGVHPADEEGNDGLSWDGVDAACYYGTDADHITAIDLVQLKYSGSDPAKAWSVPRLASTSNKSKTNAVINRLATAWKTMRAKHPDLDREGKIQARLVSNQPVAAEVATALSAASSDTEREKLRKASGLNKTDFGPFVAALDLSECGGDSRFAHEEKVINALSQLKSGGIGAEFAELREFIRKRMRPEGAHAVITAESIFGIFNHADPRMFFPCASRIELVSQVIPREAAKILADAFCAGELKLCLTGSGGEGKTTALQDLARRLPQGSELVVYDCYGAGTYLNSDGYRHRPEDAFLQLANEVASRLLLPPLLAERNADHPRRFKQKLEAAAEVLAQRNAGALLVIAVDAADNAVTAAQSFSPPEKAFVHEFASLGSLPANVRLLVTTRRGRLDSLRLPENFRAIPIGPFTEQESKAFAHQRLGPQADPWHVDFHTHSGGNPRVEHYAIDFGAGDPGRALAYLKPNGKDLAGIFGSRLEEAKQRSGAETDLKKLCAALTSLPRPVPIHHLAAIVDIEEDHARDLISDLAPGIMLNQSGAGFADEDFEHFVMEAGEPKRAEVIEACADRLLALRNDDAYACTHVASLVLLAKRRELVLDLVHEPPGTYPLGDPGARGEVHRRRLRSAMHVCRDSRDHAEAASLLLEGAQAIKTDEAVRQALANHVELAANLSREKIIGLVLRDPSHRPRHGALLLQLAAADGIHGDGIGFRSNYRAFVAWERARQEASKGQHDQDDDDGEGYVLPGDRSRDWLLDADDVAAMLVGELHASGAARALEGIAGARPARFREQIFHQLVRRLARRDEQGKLQEVRDALPKRHPWRLSIEFALGVMGQPVDPAALLTRLERAATAGAFSQASTEYQDTPGDSVTEAIGFLLDACDLVALYGGDRERLLAVLAHAMPAAARSPAALSSYAAKGSDAAVRAFALASVLGAKLPLIEQFIIDPTPANELASAGPTQARRSRKAACTENYAAKEEQRRAREKAEVRYGPILAFHNVRSRILVGEISPGDAPGELMKAAISLSEARERQYRQDEWRPRDDAAIKAAIMVGAVPGIDCAALFAAISKALGPLPTLMRAQAKDILERASIVSGFRAPVVDLAVASCEDVRAIKMSAEEKINHLAALAELTLPLDRDAAIHCFDAAMSVAGDVDYDTLHAIAILAPLAMAARARCTGKDADRIAGAIAAISQDAAVRIGDGDHFPWSDIAVAIAAIAPSIAIAAAARFGEVDLLRGHDFLASVLEQIAVDGTLEDRTLAGLLPLLDRDGSKLASLLIERAAASGDGALAEEASQYLLREQVGDWAEIAPDLAKLGNSGEWSNALQRSAAFLAELYPAESKDSGSSFSSDTATVNPTLFDVSTIDDAAGFIARIDQIIAAQGETHSWRTDIAEQLLLKVPPHRMGRFLGIVAAIPESDLIGDELGRLLSVHLKRWKGHLAAREWAENHLLEVIEARLPELIRYIGYRDPQLEALFAFSGAGNGEIATRLLGAIERHIDDLSSYSIFRLVGVLALYLTAEEASGLLDRHSQAMWNMLEASDRELAGFETLGTAAETAGRLLYAELGSIEHERRWRAAHGLRILARLHDAATIDLVRARYEIQAEPALGHPTAPFYFLAARLWFMLALARVAWEQPAIIAPLGPWLFEQGERSDFPHLLIRAAARQALEGLEAANPCAFGASDVARIRAINESPFKSKRSTEQRWERGFDRHNPPKNKDRRFRFDSLDTLPYWYSPFLRCFAKPTESLFLDRAEHWIVDRLGISGDVWEYDKLRGNNRFNRFGLDRSDHRHGSLPAIERYRTHLEWHAMFLAGGELLAEWPLALTDEEDSWDSFPSWLARHLPTFAPAWLSDLRAPKPLEPDYWRGPDADSWLKAPDRPAIQRALGLDEPQNLVLSSYISIKHRNLSGSRRSESALVSPETATALRLALEARNSSQHYRLAVPDHEQVHSTSGSRFVLKAILAEGHGETELDTHDPWRGDVTAPSYLPRPQIIRELSLVRDPSGLPLWRDQDGNGAIHARAWSDPVQHRRGADRDLVSGGELLIRRDVLARLLALEKLDLIGNVTFRRSVGEYDYGEKNKKNREREFDHIILFRQEGITESRTRGLGRWT